MAFPPELSSARLRATYFDATGELASGEVVVAAKQRNRVGDAFITSGQRVVPLVDGKLDVPVPVGDDVDLQAPLYLEVTERISGERSTQRYTVEVTAADIVTVTEAGQPVSVVHLAKLAPIGGSLPIAARGYVRTINGALPDTQGNITLEVGDIQLPDDLVTTAELGAAIDAIPTADLTEYAKTTAVGPLASTAALATIAPIQTAVNEARKGVVDGSFGVSVGIHDAAPASLYSSQNPAAEYDPVTNRTYVSYLSSEQRALTIRYFDHATGTFSQKYYIADYLITNLEDTHGAPSLAIDQNARRIIISFGVHNTNLALARSGADLDITSWTVSRPAFASSYGHVAYDAVSKTTFVMFRAGTAHTSNGGTVPNAHECARFVKSTDGGASWTEVVGARINTKIIYTSDLGTDFYGSDLDAYNGRVYISFSIAHAASGSADPHDGPRAGAYVCYLDPTDGLLHAVDGQVIDLYTTAADFAKARVASGDFSYPIKTAVNPSGQILTAFNKYDSAVNYVRNYAALWDGTKWTVTDTGVYANYLYNGTAIQYRVIGGVGTWEILAVRNLNGDNVVASTDQKDTLNGASNGGDVVKLKSTDGLTFAVDAVWDAERFTTPITYVQSVRYAHPGLLFLLQGVLYSTIADKSTGVDASRGSGNIASYNTSDWQSEIFFMYASTNLPAVLNIVRRPEVRYNVNPIYRLVGSSSTPQVTPPTSWSTLSLSPEPLPRGARSVRLRVTLTATTPAAGRVYLAFRQSGSNRDSDDDVTFNGALGYTQVATVDVPVGADGAIQWIATTDSGITATVGLTIRSFNLGSQRLVPKAPKTGIAKAATTTVTIPVTAPPTPDTTPPTAPTSVSATGGNGQATLTPTGASDNVAVTGYKAYTAASGGTVAASGASPLTVTGLTNGTAYTFYVSAVDAAGNESARTASAQVTPAAPVGGASSYSNAFAATPTDWTTALSSGGTGAFAASGGVLKFSGAPSSTISAWYLSPYAGSAANEYAQLDVTGISGNIHPSVVLNYTDATNYVIANYDGTAGAWKITEFVNGVTTGTGTATGSAVAVPSIPYTLRLERAGTSYTVKAGPVGGALATVLTSTASGLAGGKTGTRFRVGSTIEAALSVDNFDTGTVTA